MKQEKNLLLHLFIKKIVPTPNNPRHHLCKLLQFLQLVPWDFVFSNKDLVQI